MVRKLLLSTILLGLSWLLNTTSITAATCEDKNGRCVFSGSCANGNALDSDDCTFPGFRCCPVIDKPDRPEDNGGAGITCASKGGTCVFQGSCGNGPTLSSSDCTFPGFRCCPTVNKPGGPGSCEGQGGKCVFQGSCANGAALSAPDCTAVGFRCCPGANSTGTQPRSGPSALCPDGVSVNTAFGCLAAGDPKALISQLLGWGVTVGGGIAFLMIVLSGFQMTTAAGDPKRVQAARELLVSAISGLILIVISVLLLNFLGLNILGLGSLGFNI